MINILIRNTRIGVETLQQNRYWSNHIKWPYTPSYWELVRTSLPIATTRYGYKELLEVIKIANQPGNGSDLLELFWTTPTLMK